MLGITSYVNYQLWFIVMQRKMKAKQIKFILRGDILISSFNILTY